MFMGNRFMHAPLITQPAQKSSIKSSTKFNNVECFSIVLYYIHCGQC